MRNKLLKWIYTIENHPVITSIHQGFMMTVPILIAGSCALLIRNFPIPQVQEFLANAWGGFWNNFLLSVINATTDLMSVFLVLCISFFYSTHFVGGNHKLQMMGMITTFACFIASFGDSLSLGCFGTTGVLTAMLSAIVGTQLFFGVYKRLLGGFHAYTAGANHDYKNAMTSIVPLMVAVVVFVAANRLMQAAFGIGNLNDLVSQSLLALFGYIQGELQNGVLFTLLLHLLWMFGVHGGNVLDPVAQLIFVPANTDPTAIISKSFLDNFVMMGGCGTAVCLLVVLLVVSHKGNSRQLARSAAPLVLFNINEILVFGLPIVLNPLMLIPFLLVPLVALLIAYTATIIGWMPIVNQTVAWTTPLFLSGYLATGSYVGVLVQGIIVLVGSAIYLPFVQMAERRQSNMQEFMLTMLTKQFHKDEKQGIVGHYLGRNDDVGVVAKRLVNRLRENMSSSNIPLFYQPQVNQDGTVVGAEALLRWDFGANKVYPPLVIALAREDGCLEELSWNILNTVCADISTMRIQMQDNFKISANIVAEQLDNKEFILRVIGLAKQHDVCGHLCLEVTEETSLENFRNITTNIDLLRKEGIPVAIDDFSMGQTSLNYLKNNTFEYVKLDGALVRQIVDNSRCCKIVASIVQLGKSLGFKVTAEYVETQQIQDILSDLGCHSFQGYLYSPAIPLEEFLAYYVQTKGKERLHDV